MEKHGLMKYLQDGVEGQKKPDYPDLAHLHKLILERKAIKILEFGVGWTTIILADASRVNNGKVFSVDASKKWINVANKLIPPELKEYVELCYSEVRAGTFNGRMCHFYKSLPDIIPDFIYLDGPDPKDVQENINGLSWQNKRSLVAADILLMEPTLTERTFIVVDGRTNNGRFLANNLQRNWVIKSNANAHVTTFELVESFHLVKGRERILKKYLENFKKVKSFKEFKDLIRKSVRYIRIRM